MAPRAAAGGHEALPLVAHREASAHAAVVNVRTVNEVPTSHRAARVLALEEVADLGLGLLQQLDPLLASAATAVVMGR
jgi:hypothetical protein